VNPLKAIYIWLYVLVNLTALALLARQWFKEHNPNRKTDLYFIWLAGNTAVLLCVGGVWGFHAYHRYSAWALPAELVCFIPILPRRAWIWILVAAVSVAIAVSSMMRNMVGI
jgi:amino acid transporter